MSNDVIIEAWNTVLFDKFSRFKHLLIDGLSSHSEEALVRHQHNVGHKVLDIGCGFGDSTIRIAKTLGPNGLAVGVDCASNFIKECEMEASKASVENAEFLVADVEADDMGGPYDEAFARFGTMFFNMPGAAMRNIRLSLKPGGKFTQIVWRKREDNPWLYEAEVCVKVHNKKVFKSPEKWIHSNSSVTFSTIFSTLWCSLAKLLALIPIPSLSALFSIKRFTSLQRFVNDPERKPILSFTRILSGSTVRLTTGTRRIQA